MNKRLHYIDIARALAMFFIVFGHTIVHNPELYPLYKLIYSFHIVLFFIISGYVYKIDKTWKLSIIKKIKKILIPYFVFSSLFLIPFFLFGNDVIDSLDITKKFNIQTLFFEIVYGVGSNGALKQNTSLWFLPALFSTEVLYIFISLILNKINLKNKDFILFVFLLIIAFYSTKLSFVLPWGLNSALVFLFFYHFGHMLKKYSFISDLYNKNIFKIFLIFFCIMCLSLFNKNITVSCVDYRYGNIFIFLFTSITLSLLVLTLSYKINENKILESIGQNTLSILIFHKLLVIVFQTKISMSASLINSSNIFVSILTASVISLVSIAICFLIGKLIHQYIPSLYGEKYTKVRSKFSNRRINQEKKG